MSRPNSAPETVFGYLSSIESAEHGYFGGYLLISPLGRPLEFHCTAPLRPSRAHQILFGPTLDEYLLGEQIGGTLLRAARLVPQIVLIDQVSVLCLRSQSTMPLVYLAPEGVEPGAGHQPPEWVEGRRDHAASRRFRCQEYQWELPPGFESERDGVVALLTSLATHVDLPEPFCRIHDAILEAQRIGRQGPDSQSQAA